MVEHGKGLDGDVIHTVGPVARGHVGPTESNDLTSCYQNSLRLMKENDLSTVKQEIPPKTGTPPMYSVTLIYSSAATQLGKMEDDSYALVLFFALCSLLRLKEQHAVTAPSALTDRSHHARVAVLALQHHTGELWELCSL
ncbi:hypothetical protein NQZ68_022980 [Dissostichus eleginoides]|nr:hypothetical protein NQZ68_022980 [Dissostichus eleginoides]